MGTQRERAYLGPARRALGRLQGDEPYGSNRLLGYSYIDGQDEIGAHQNGTADQRLLQVDSDPSGSFRWGDMDRLYFVLTKTELEARDFSKVRFYQQRG